MRRRYRIPIYAFSLLFWALPVTAQVEFKGLQTTLSASVDTGYSGDIDNLGGSSHGLGLGGQGTLSGSYYNPDFLSFSALPYYNRSQVNADGASIFDTYGYSGNVNIFGGSHFPGSISFSQVWDSTGSYGIPGVTGLTTKDNSRGFGIGWSELVPGLPSLGVSFSRGSGSSSVLGSDAQTDVTTDSLAIHSGYRLRGWTLGASFDHVISNSGSTGLLGTGEQETNTTSTGYGFNVGHSLPLHGGFGLGFSRTEYSDTFLGITGGSSHGTTDNAFGNLSFLLWRFPISATATYTDNLYGSFEQYLLANGGTAMYTELTPESRALIMNVSTVYHVMPHVFVTGFVGRTETYLGGQSYGATQVGATVNATFGERFKGLTATFGMNDNLSQYGNTGATLVANVNYIRNIGRWNFLATFNYNQYIQTMLPMSQMSNMNYNVQIHRQLAGGLSWNVGAGGGRTAFPTISGDVDQAWAVSSALSWRLCRCELSGNYSQSNGTSVLTATGLVAVPLPIVSNNLVTFNAQSRGFSFSISPLRAMSISTSYAKSTSNTLGTPGLSSPNGLASNNENELISGILTYRLRKLNFNAEVLQFRQGISSSGLLPSVVSSYYFSVSRWLKLF
jgi:hypothetical protein